MKYHIHVAMTGSGLFVYLFIYLFRLIVFAYLINKTISVVLFINHLYNNNNMQKK